MKTATNELIGIGIYAVPEAAHLGANVYLGSRSKWGIAGHLDPAWNIIENVPRDVLLERGSKA